MSNKRKSEQGKEEPLPSDNLAKDLLDLMLQRTESDM